MKTTKVKFDVLCCVGHILQIEIWNEENELHYSWHHDFAKEKKWNEPEDALCSISVEELDQMIDNLRENCEITQGMKKMDPSYYTLDIVDRDGKEIRYHWSDDDYISIGLNNFLSNIEEIIGDVSFSIKK